METKAKKDASQKKDDVKATAETKKKDVADSKAGTKTSADVTAENKKSGKESIPV